MANRRPNELEYGQLGEPTYDTEEKKWLFTRNFEARTIRPLRPLAPLNNLPGHYHALAGSIRSGDAFSSLMSVGKGYGPSQNSRSRYFPLVAKVGGEGANILQFMRPGIDHLGWQEHKGISLETLNLEESAVGYWCGSASPIQQVTFSEDTEGSSGWLAVRQATRITIFKPTYLDHPVRPPLSGISLPVPSSRLSANPIVTISITKLGLREHVDLAFNPWYSRQFAVMDTDGNWNIFDLEGGIGVKARFEATSGAGGHIYDDPARASTATGPSPRWGRLLWCGNVSTLVICNRRHISVFDVEGTPKRLPCAEIIPSDSTDWILDLRRSPVKPNHFVLLTTSQIFWLEISPGSDWEKENNRGGAKVILTFRHFRDVADENMKLELFQDDEACAALLYSPRCQIINIFRLSDSSTPAVKHFSSFASLPLRMNSKSQTIQSLHVIPAHFIPTFKHGHLPSGPGLAYSEQGVLFHQLLAISCDLTVSETVFATSITEDDVVEGQNPVQKRVLPPDVVNRRISFRRHSNDDYDFVVPDEMDIEYESQASCDMDSIRSTKNSKQLVLFRNARELLNQALVHEYPEPEKDETVEARENATDAYTSITSSILQNVVDSNENDTQGLPTLLELSSIDDVPTLDIEDIASAIDNMLFDIQQLISDDMTATKELKDLGLSQILTGLEQDASFRSSKLTKLYDKLVDIYVTNLPRKTPGSARLAKERLIRRVATELYLASIAISFVSADSHDAQKIEEAPTMDSSAPMSTSASQPSLPPLLHSISSSLPHPKETSKKDPQSLALARLGALAASMDSPFSLSESQSTVLSQWLSLPNGADPYDYKWTSIRQEMDSRKEAEESAAQGLSRKEERKRLRRNEKLQRQREADAAATMSQPVVPRVVAFGSDPVTGKGETQATQATQGQEELPMTMTQPVMGVFGSRAVTQKKKKKPKTAGFR